MIRSLSVEGPEVVASLRAIQLKEENAPCYAGEKRGGRG
jgi:hypothetical protein